jgi:hypothetical protein
VNLVAMTKNVLGHLGVPEAGLVTEVDAGFQHFTHCYCHGISYLEVVSKSTLQSANASPGDQPPIKTPPTPQ